MSERIYELHDGEACEKCGATEDVVCDEGDWACTDCLFEQSCEQIFREGLDL